MSTSSFMGNYYDSYKCVNKVDKPHWRCVNLNLPEELGGEMTVPKNEEFLWFKIALIRYHLKEFETG